MCWLASVYVPDTVWFFFSGWHSIQWVSIGLIHSVNFDIKYSVEAATAILECINIGANCTCFQFQLSVSLLVFYCLWSAFASGCVFASGLIAISLLTLISLRTTFFDCIWRVTHLMIIFTIPEQVYCMALTWIVNEMQANKGKTEKYYLSLIRLKCSTPRFVHSRLDWRVLINWNRIFCFCVFINVKDSAWIIERYVRLFSV